MSDYRRLIDEMQHVLYSTGPAEKSSVLRIAEEYHVACVEANDRLRGCGRLLRRGLRSEAIQQCEIEPNLLEIVAVLDLPELPQWSELLAQINHPSPPSLLLDLGAELNAAYALEAPLSEMLRTHRLLALGRAPLASRLKNLRRIAERDPANQVWSTDIAAFEAGRLREIDAQASKAIQAKDFPTLRSLADEIQDPQWRMPIPGELQARIRNCLAAEDLRSDRESLLATAAALENAHLELDAVSARRLRSLWDELTERRPEAADEGLWSRVMGPLAWLREEDGREAEDQRFAAAVDQFSALVAAPESTIERLDQAYRDLLPFEREIPAGLAERYRVRVEQLRDAEQRQRMWWTVSLGAAAGALLAVVWLAVSYVRQEYAVANAANQLQLFADAGLDEIDAALQYAGALPESIQLDARVQTGLKGIEALRLQDEDRRQRFERQLSEIEALDPLAADPTDLLQRLEGLPRTAEDGKRRDQLLTAKAAAREATFRSALTSLAAAKKASLADWRAYVAQLGALLKAQAGVSSPLVEEARAAERQAVAELQQVQLSDDLQQAQARLTSTLGKPSDFARSLRLLSQIPNLPQPQVDQVKAVLAEEELWDHSARWRVFSDQWNRTDRATLGPFEAARLKTPLDFLLGKFPGMPQAEAAREAKLSEFLAAIIARRTPEGKSLSETMSQLVRHPTMLELGLLTTRGGKVYYLSSKSKPVMQDGMLHFEYIETIGLRARKETLPAVDVVAVKEQAPHCEICARILEKFAKNPADPDWEKEYYALLKDIREAPGLDPILQVVLLKVAITTGSSGSQPLAEAFRGARTLLDDKALDLSVAWMNPDDIEASAARQVARSILARLPDFRALGQHTEQQLRACRAHVMPTPEWIGWALARADGTWVCQRGDQPLPPGTLHVLLPSQGNAAERWLPVGDHASPRLRGAAESLALGRPIFHQGAAAPPANQPTASTGPTP